MTNKTAGEVFTYQCGHPSSWIIEHSLIAINQYYADYKLLEHVGYILCTNELVGWVLENGTDEPIEIAPLNESEATAMNAALDYLG